MKIFKCIVVTLSVFLSLNVVAGTYVALDSNITEVINTNGNSAAFSVKVSGGTGPCAGKAITFPAAAAGDYSNGRSEMHNRAYSAALTALTTGMKVDIHNYVNGDCLNAVFIRVKK